MYQEEQGTENVFRVFGLVLGNYYYWSFERSCIQGVCGVRKSSVRETF
jgi:hypothetical protein